MLGISSLAVFWARRVKIPHTVFLVLVGLVLGFLSHFSFFSFFSEFHLTPELLFYLLLPTLIFESAYNINIRRLIEDSIPVFLLAIVGLLISTLVIGVSLFYALALFGLNVPFILTLLFGALISATDPVAVLALFKEFGVPRRLSLIFEGESLFNDATAVALFLILIEIAQTGFHGTETVFVGLVSFTSMILGGILFGLIVGAFFAKIIGMTRENEVASITLTIVLAHTTFILAEIISEHAAIGAFEFPLSPIIATTVAALFMGNYGRSKINPRAEEFVEKLWGQLAFMSNSIIFILIGIIFITLPKLDVAILVIIPIVIAIVAIARVISIYPTVSLFNWFSSSEQSIPMSWQHLLSWGSLRGALAVTMVLLVPDTLMFENWSLSISPKELLLTLTVGCIFATLFIKATTIEKIVAKLKLDKLTSLEEIEELEARALMSHEVTERITQYEKRGYINPTTAGYIRTEHDQAYDSACEHLSTITISDLGQRVIRMFAIGIERCYLKDLYDHGEVNEVVFKRLSGKLQLQFESIEQGDLAPDMSLHTDGKDIFEVGAAKLKKYFVSETDEQKTRNLYMYYRAQSILSRKVVKELSAINRDEAEHIFSAQALTDTIELYTKYREQSATKLYGLEANNTEIIQSLSHELANMGVKSIKEKVLKELFERELITPKLYIKLSEELH